MFGLFKCSEIELNKNRWRGLKFGLQPWSPAGPLYLSHMFYQLSYWGDPGENVSIRGVQRRKIVIDRIPVLKQSKLTQSFYDRIY